MSTTSTEDAPEATVTLSDSNEFQFSFKLQKGQDGVNGTAQDGKFTEFRFAVNSSNITPPSLSNTVRTPEGWSLTPPTKSNSQYLWMTTAVINPNDTLFRN